MLVYDVPAEIKLCSALANYKPVGASNVILLLNLYLWGFFGNTSLIHCTVLLAFKACEWNYLKTIQRVYIRMALSLIGLNSPKFTEVTKFTSFRLSCSRCGKNTLLKRWSLTNNSLPCHPAPPQSVILILCYLFAEVEVFSGALLTCSWCWMQNNLFSMLRLSENLPGIIRGKK